MQGGERILFEEGHFCTECASHRYAEAQRTARLERDADLSLAELQRRRRSAVVDLRPKQLYDAEPELEDVERQEGAIVFERGVVAAVQARRRWHATRGTASSTLLASALARARPTFPRLHLGRFKFRTLGSGERCLRHAAGG